ncbi:MAG: hypothetical protein AAF826_12320, partial [Pseudomonadota bacterium]
VALNAFVKSLHEYRDMLFKQGIDINVKGAGWLAAFPEPNRTVQLRVRTTGEAELLPTSEALEVSADSEPFEFDFLGKAIDTGFRVASNAQPGKLVLSVQLARLLAGNRVDLGFAHDVRLDRPIVLKGVNKNEPYPVLYIDTMDHLPTKKAKLLEREVLGESTVPVQNKLSEYLEAYCGVVGTEEIMLKTEDNSEDVQPPASYLKHKDKISEHLLGERQREFDGSISDEDETVEQDVMLDGVTLTPIDKK